MSQIIGVYDGAIKISKLVLQLEFGKYIRKNHDEK